ncbi:hypothetical protein GCM10010885_03540 [Alicyclobacillus cellulosilyticus]|uniref:DUF881 domain-containing protein n=1 Tax=Alicyclobacillus cellulosilyticus TaxID=1003997 RepID=A0A917K275_9BACL|nr:DUF881 domain-containing protein [Alicyclobacillus cellulosilyticus]GGI97260.1 hypothetical protein GCM10010885_03540 [Alicyclobacillus cellulosilyticus]
MTGRAQWAVSLTLASLVLGFMMALQYRQTQTGRLDAISVHAYGTEEKRLQNELAALKEANARAEQQLARLTAQLAAYEKEMAGSNSQLARLQQRLQQERILAGLTPVEGPGVSVVLMDGIAVNSDTEQVLTHDWDVRSVINELFTAGAEAVSINGYRVVATSGIFCTGPVVRINGHRIGAPFTIEAIGDPHTLKSALEIQGGILDALRARGVNVSAPTMEDDIKMPAFTGNATAGAVGAD